MTDSRSYQEIRQAHPFPWNLHVLPGIRNGMAQMIMVDGNKKEVPLLTIMRVVQLVTHAAPPPTTTTTTEQAT